MKEWEKFKVGTYSTSKNWTNPDFQRLTKVLHVSHIETAFNILKDKKVRSGLIYDKSKLNTERILVCWLSPNIWTHGSRYGNIAFEFDFATVVQNKKFYWVEVMTEYKPVACRILVTTNNYDSVLEPYDPSKKSGPLFFAAAAGKYYWNGTICLELMIEQDLPLSSCSAVSITHHHDEFCCIDPKTCSDMSQSSTGAAAKFLAGVVARNVSIDVDLFRTYDHNDEKYRVSLDFRNGYKALLTEAKGTTFSGTMLSSDPHALTYLRAALSFYVQNETTEFLRLLSNFSSFKEVQHVLFNCIETKFDSHLS